MVDLPDLQDFLLACPVIDRHAREVSRAHGCRLDASGPLDRGIDEVSLELHEEVVLTGTPVDLEGGEVDPGILLHRIQDVGYLESQGFQSGADDMVLVHAARQSGDHAAGVGIPVGRSQTGKCRNHIASVRIRNFFCKIFGILGGLDELHLVAEPLDRRARHVDGTLKGVLDLAAKSPGDGREEPVLREDRLFTRVHQHEASGPVGVLGFAGSPTGLAEEGCLLIACDAGDRDRIPEEDLIGIAEYAGGRQDFREHAARNIELFKNFIVPVECVDVEEHGPRGVRIIRCVDLTVAQLPHEPCVDRSEEKVSLLGSFAGALYIFEDPAKLRRREVGIDDQSGLFTELFRESLRDEGIRVIGSPSALPDDRIADRLSRHAVPDDGRFPLIRDSDCRDILRGGPDLLHRLLRDKILGGPDLVRVMLDPARLREDLGELLLRDAAHFACPVEEDAAIACRSCIQSHDIFCHIVLLSA